MFTVNLISSSIYSSIEYIAIFRKVGPIVNSMFRKNLQLNDLQLGIFRNDSSCAILLGAIPGAIFPSASFKFNEYELDVFRYICSPFTLLPMHIEEEVTATSFTDHLEHKISTLVAIPRHMSFFHCAFFQLLYNLNMKLLTFYMSCCPKKHSVR